MENGVFMVFDNADRLGFGRTKGVVADKFQAIVAHWAVLVAWAEKASPFLMSCWNQASNCILREHGQLLVGGICEFKFVNRLTLKVHVVENLVCILDVELARVLAVGQFGCV